MTSSHHRITARKRFGQNFLHDHGVLRQMAQSIRGSSGDVLLEIGPGKGALTSYLLQTVPSMLGVELDRDLVAYLKSQYSSEQLQLVPADILNVDIASVLADAGYKDTGSLVRVVGNLPYNITTPLLFHLFKQLSIIDDMHFLVQKEVAVRLVADIGSKQYSRLTVMANYFCDIEILFDVPPESFDPIPKVNSSFIRLYPHKKYSLSEDEFSVFSAVLQHVFTMKRKTLRNSLKALLTGQDIESLSVDLSVRPQEVSIDQYIKLSQEIKTNFCIKGR